MNSFNILVVDDEPFILDILSLFLCDEGFNVQGVHSNNEALDYLTHTNFDLILTDLHMKGMPFQDFIYFVRNNYSFSEIPIIVVTGIPDALDKNHRDLVQGIIEKPFSPDVIIDSIRALLPNKVLTC